MSTDKPSSSARNRTPRPINPTDYAALQTVQLGVFFSTYAEAPRPQEVPAALKLIYELNLHISPQDKHGIAGALAGLAKLHPQEVRGWQAAWPKVYDHALRLKPPEEDSDVTQVGAIDYLWMLALVANDEHAVERIIRIGHRKDPVGDAAVVLVHRNLACPIMLRVLKRVAPAKAPAPIEAPVNIPLADVMKLTQEAACHPVWRLGVLYVAYQPPTAAEAAAFVVTTPDGRLPDGFPVERGGRRVIARTATEADLAKWRKLQGEKDTP